jgi:peptide/nickel transport system substrate-binding protein
MLKTPWAPRIVAGLTVGVGIALLVGVLASGTSGQEGRVPGGHLVIAFPNNEAADATSLDPNVGGGATFVNSIMGGLYDQLVYQDPKTGKVIPGLAEKWDITGDGTQYTFHLTSKALFWDGTRLTAEDVKFTLDRTVDKKYLPGNGYSSVLMANYDRSEVVNPTTIKVFLKRPQTNFLPSVVGRTYLGIVSKAAAEKLGVPKFGEQPLGSGPFEFVEWVRGDHITVKRNSRYAWGPAFFETAGKAPSVERITYRFIQEDSTRLAALESGQVNAIIGIPAFDQARFDQSREFEIIKVRKNGQAGGVNLNTQQFPTSEQPVRQAIAYAVNRDALNRTVYAGRNFPAYHLLEERMGEWVNQKARFPNYDAAKARQILDQAGWMPEADGIRAKGGRKLALIGICPPDMQQAMTLLQAQLKEVGIDMSVQPGSASQVYNILQSPSGSYNVAWPIRAGWTNEDPYLMYSHNNSKNMPPNGMSNYSKVSVPEIDRLLDTAAVTADPTRRKELYYKAQEVLVEYVPFVPILSFNLNMAVVKGVRGLMPDIRGTYTYFNDVWIDKPLQDKWRG